MLDLPGPILNILVLFSPLFSQPVFKNMASLFVGHVLTKGHRTVADILRTLDLSKIKNFSKFHWVLSSARWSAFKAAGILLTVIISTFSLKEVIIPLDTHVERRKGEKIRGLGRQRDAVRSTKNRKVLTVSLLWLVAGVSVKLPFCRNHWTLPFFSQLIMVDPKNWTDELVYFMLHKQLSMETKNEQNPKISKLQEKSSFGGPEGRQNSEPNCQPVWGSSHSSQQMEKRAT